MRRTRYRPLTLLVGFAIGLWMSASSCALWSGSARVAAEETGLAPAAAKQHPRAGPEPGFRDVFVPLIERR
jgi:hypothetical protein